MSGPALDVAGCRRQFPGLERAVAGRPAVFFDGPAGSQVPRRVADAVARVLLEHNANTGGSFETSRHTDEILQAARESFAAFLGAADPGEVVFGPNMTTLTMSLAAALGRTWKAGDEIVVTRAEHDANFTPWIRAAADAGARVRYVGIREEDCAIDIAALADALSGRTRLVTVACASNAVGTLQPFAEIVRLARAAGAVVFLDAVHYAPHAAIDVAAWGCDFLACSAYKFFGPHVSVLWGRRELLDELPVLALRPAHGRLERWMPGTQNHEGIAGAAEAVAYLADLGRETAGASATRPALLAAFAAIGEHERALASRLLSGLAGLRDVRVWGIADPRRMEQRLPTVAFTHARHEARDIARRLGERGVFVWDGNFYSLPLTEALGLEPAGLVRAGLLHYNTAEEVDRFLEELATIR